MTTSCGSGFRCDLVGAALVGAASAAILLATTAHAQPPDEPQVTVQSLAPDLHLLFGAGGGQVAGNVLALTGADGVVVVDTGFPVFVPKYRAAIAELGGGVGQRDAGERRPVGDARTRG